MQKSAKEFDKYKIVQKGIENELNLKEIEEDIKKIIKG
jgi:hypothetical protein